MSPQFAFWLNAWQRITFPNYSVLWIYKQDMVDNVSVNKVFDNRIEIVSLGHLPNSLTVEKIRHGNSIIRNPILVSYASKGILPYRGLGSGIKRALDAWPEIDFFDDREQPK